jgi:hypothetical protein
MVTGDKDLSLRPKAEIVSLRETVYETAVQTFIATHAELASIGTDVLFAEASLAREIPPRERSRAQRELAHMLDTIISVENAVNDGIITSAEDADVITDAIMSSTLNPSKVVRYLKAGDFSKLDRALSPKELAVALSVHDEVSYNDSGISLATIVRAADASGVSLVGPLSDADIFMISGRISMYDAVVEQRVVEDDPIDGPVSARRIREISGSSIFSTRDSEVHPLSASDVALSIGERMEDFASRTNIEDDEIDSEVFGLS